MLYSSTSFEINDAVTKLATLVPFLYEWEEILLNTLDKCLELLFCRILDVVAGRVIVPAHEHDAITFYLYL